MAERRALSFASLDDVMPEVDRLLAGHTTVGRWSLAQILYHVAAAIRLGLDAPPGASEPTREQDVARRLFFRAGRFPEGGQVPIPLLSPPPGLDAHTEAANLRSVLERFASATGPFPAHPRLGRLTKDEWSRFHCMHCAHHLGFTVPGD
jgi:hypothetical protein